MNGQCECDHDDWPNRPRWWNADSLELAAWRALVFTLSDSDLIRSAMDAHLGQSNGKFEESAWRKITANVERLRQALIEAEADRYASDDRLRHEEVVKTLTSPFGCCLRERDRMEALRADSARADQLRAQWVLVADGVSHFYPSSTPSPEEQKEIYSKLSVRFQITAPRVISRTIAATDAPDDVPLAEWISVVGVELPSNNGGERVHPSP